MAGSLKNKIAVIYGAGGSIGSTVARAFAAEGAKVFVTGRNITPLEAVAKSITDAGGLAETAVVDALDEKSVETFIEGVAKKEGHVDISYNAIALDPVQDIPLIEMTTEEFIYPIKVAMQSHFITARAAGRQMKKQGSGVILSLSATPAGVAYPLVGGFGPACSALEAFTRNLASELGQYNVRVVGMRSAGSPDSAVFAEFIASGTPESVSRIKKMKGDTMLGRLPMMNEIANLAVFLVSDKASGLTGTTVNVTCGTTMD